ncbi:ATP-dependent zinc protease [Aestuariirhabdus sp. Z084]|uniref:ATP-dependent zinc protease family protein n=1 Tax=Aestuariirhabdus haliotis TaxID=2918751 RepID=UPI00201B410F|nr:ATP-dependent zinc protease [Aestuariirhabdus haliotis]MCL6416867.1 ATP-dependent zinc protease [Aestuariirhabdus haliotis]MCL6420857.1 ATP-dependent zinc protease [Aestuariirhabdus haliotis]
MERVKGKMLVGAIEQCDLPELEICGLHVRIDTGAQTSSLHVDNLEEFEQAEETWVRFDIHPDIHQVESIVRCEAKITGKRKVKSSNGTFQKRYRIDTRLRMGGEEWPIQLTLADRSEMSYLMLLGRQAMGSHMIVDPSANYLLK